jgi:hypothetical protein
MLDKETFKQKPNGYQTGGIQKRLSQTEIDIEELSKLLSNGATFKPALLNGTKSSDWVSQQIFALDFDGGTTIQDELNRCEQLEVRSIFGYTSFSYTEENHKFRLVFCSSEVITDINIRNNIQNMLIYLFPNSDKVTFDPTRLFYGGRNLITTNYNNRIDVNDFMIKYDDILKSLSNADNSKGVRFPNTNKISSLKSSFNSMEKPQKSVESNISDHIINIQAIKTLNVQLMKSILNIDDNITYCDSKQEVYDIINQIDLCTFTGINDNVICILPDHDDSTPSAHIYTTDSGTQIYKCFGCDAKYTIISLVEKLAKCKRIKAINFIKDVYNIVLNQSDWQKEQLEIYDTNIELLLSEEFKEVYPELYSLIRTRKSDIVSLNNFAKINLKDESFSVNDTPLFFISLVNLMDILGSKDKTKVSQSITLFTLLSLLDKIPHSTLPEDILNKAKHIAAKYNHKKLTNFYSIGSYGVLSLEESNKIACILRKNNISLKGLSREYLLRTFGEDFTNKIFPQYEYENSKGTTQKSDDKTFEISKQILDAIKEYGYILEKDIKINNITESQWKRSIQEILDSYDLVRITANKEIKEQYNIQVSERSYPKIIIKNPSENGGF